MTSVAISYLKNSVPSKKTVLLIKPDGWALHFPPFSLPRFRVCFSTVTRNSSTSPRQLWQMRPVIPLRCCQILPHSVSFGPLPSGGCLSLYPWSRQPLGSLVEKSNQKDAPMHTCIPWKLGSDSRSLLPLTSLARLQSRLPVSHSQPFSFPVPSLLQRQLQLWALYLNQGYKDTFPLVQLTCDHELPRFRTKTLPHTDKAALNWDKGLPFLMLYEIPLHLPVGLCGVELYGSTSKSNKQGKTHP